MRTALGAGRWRLVRQLLTESTLLSVAGGIVGIVFAWSTVDMLTRFVGRFTARTGEIELDPGVLVFTLLVSVVTGLVFGTFPALASRVDLVGALKTRRQGHQRRRRWPPAAKRADRRAGGGFGRAARRRGAPAHEFLSPATR